MALFHRNESEAKILYSLSHRLRRWWQSWSWARFVLPSLYHSRATIRLCVENTALHSNQLFEKISENISCLASHYALHLFLSPLPSESLGLFALTQSCIHFYKGSWSRYYVPNSLLDDATGKITHSLLSWQTQSYRDVDLKNILQPLKSTDGANAGCRGST